MPAGRYSVARASEDRFGPDTAPFISERLRVEALGPGRIVLTRADDNFDELLGALGDDVYPPGYLEGLRGEWE